MKKLLIFFQIGILFFAPLAQATGTSNTEAAHTIIREKACLSCHIVPGLLPAPQAGIAPLFEGLAKRKRLVGGLLTNTPKNLRRWLKNPKAIKSMTLMPNTALTDEEIEILIEFMNSL